MAEGGTSSVSKDAFNKSSGDADEISCDPCLNDGKSVAVDGYCQICEEFMCSNCLEVHRKQKISRGHAILDKSQMPTRPGESARQNVSIEVCNKHRPEIIRFYCKAHDETGCVHCMVLNHANCAKDWIQDLADGFKATEQFKQLNQKLDSFNSEIGELKDALSENLKNIGATSETVEQKIESFREDINAHLDEVQKQLLEEVAAWREEHETPLKTLSTGCDTLKSKVDSIIQNVQDVDNVNVSFILAKQTQKMLVELQEELNILRQKQKQRQKPKHLMFIPSPQIGKVLSSNAPLGKIAKTADLSGITATYKRTINMKASRDGGCWINGCVLLGPDRMVVTDGCNKNVKLIDLEHNRILFGFKTSTSPFGITTVNADKVAVTLPAYGSILLLNVARDITTNRVVKINCSDQDCSVIAYKDGVFAVPFVNPGRIKIVDTIGDVLYTIQPKQDTVDFLHNVLGLAFGDDNGTLVVSDAGTHKVSVISFGGDILQTYTHEHLFRPIGIDITSDGMIFVGSYGNGHIHVINPDFKSSKVFIKDDERVVQPVTISYCEMNRRLYISNLFGHEEKFDVRDNSMCVFEVETA